MFTMRVLIAEDDKTTRRMLETTLKKWGLEVVSTSDGKEACEQLQRANAPKLVLLDIMMPGIDGIEACRRLRQQETSEPPYIIFLTALEDKKDLITGLKAGADDYVTKPFDPDELKARIKAGQRILELQSSLAMRIEELENAKKVLKDSEARYRTMVENQMEAVCRWLPDTTLTYVNQAYCSFLGKNREELLGRKFLLLLPDDVHGPFKEHIDLLVANPQVKTFEHEIVAADKSIHWHEWTDCPILDDQGQIVEFQSVGRDITERRQIEEKLSHSRRMEAVGQLAGGVAHDFNNLLVGMLGGAETVKLDTEPGSAAHEAAEIIEMAATRAAKLVEQLLGFARGGRHRSAPFNLRRSICNVITLLKQTIDRGIEIKTELAAEQCTVKGDAAQIENVLINLAVNAAQAMPQGGVLTIKSGVAQFDEECIHTVAPLPPGDYAEITVTDTGTGIPEDIRSRIFEPFFTTRDHDKGTGLGLAMVYGVVRNHGGSIYVHSQKGHTTFTVYLPCAQCEAVEKTPPGHEKPLKGTGHILFVDDEDILRRTTGQMLTSLGYDVVCVSNAAEAVEYHRDHVENIDLVLIDLIMPGTDGRKCFQDLKKHNPDVKAILSSGHAPNERVQSALDDGMLSFLQKPFTRKDLSATIASVLSA